MRLKRENAEKVIFSFASRIRSLATENKDNKKDGTAGSGHAKFPLDKAMTQRSNVLCILSRRLQLENVRKLAHRCVFQLPAIYCLLRSLLGRNSLHFG